MMSDSRHGFSYQEFKLLRYKMADGLASLKGQARGAEAASRRRPGFPLDRLDGEPVKVNVTSQTREGR